MRSLHSIIASLLFLVLACRGSDEEGPPSTPDEPGRPGGGYQDAGAGGTPGGDFGATPGGVKDMRYARGLIAEGKVPPAETLLVEAMFAEHELGLAGAACEDVRCLRAAAGVAPDRAGAPHGWLEVGLSSTIDPATWTRPATTFIFTVDVSASMGWTYGETTPGGLSRRLLHALTDRLRTDDEVAIVTYGDTAAVALPLQSGADRARVHAAVDELHEDGSTNMEAGLRVGYQLGVAAARRGRGNVRLVLFTDVQPNVGATGASEFEAMVAAGADAGADITVLALGLGIGPEVLQGMAHLHGANAFSLNGPPDVETFIADDYPWFTTPIAYDLAVHAAPGPGLAVDAAYGFPQGPNAEPQTELEVSTVFLSRRKGALLVSVAPTVAGALDELAATVSLAYRTAAGEPRRVELTTARDGAEVDERGQWFAQPAVARTTALALLVSGMHQAADVYGEDPEAAEAIMRAADERFTADAAALTAPALEPEVALSHAMLALIVERAEQGTFYGGH